MTKHRPSSRLLSLFLAILMTIAMLPGLVMVDIKTAFAAGTDNQTPSTENGSISITVEILTLGDGFLYEPAQVPFSAGENYATVLDRFLGSANYKYTGSVETDLYISSVRLPRNISVNIPQIITDAVYEIFPLDSTAAGSFLSEFDIAQTSGWMYTVNNVMAPKGTSNWYPDDGDVCRLQFSVYGLGMDLGVASSWSGTEPLFIGADKSALIAEVAAINSAADSQTILADADVANAYQIANTILVDLEASQSAVDYATGLLQGAIANLPVLLPDNAVVITTDDLAMNQYETYYWTLDEEYYYQGQKVSFISTSQFTAGAATYNMKNRQITITTTIDSELGTATIKFAPDIALPIGTISGQWNSGSGGERKIHYLTGIPGLTEVWGANTNYNTLALTGLTPGTYYLTDGSFFEKCNSYSPGVNLGNGVVTQAFFGRLPDVTITIVGPEEPEPDLDAYVPTALDYVPDDWANDLWLQYDFKELTVGQNARIYPRRVEQGVSNYLTNDVERPNFNFSIVQGDSITLTLDKVGSRTNAANISAVKPGLSIVKVTYDEFRHSVNNKLFPAISEVNVAYVAFSVSDGSANAIQIDFNDSLTSYDTVYFTGQSVDYDITPSITGATSVEVTCNGLLVAAKGATYTLPLKNLQNIVGIKATDSTGHSRYAYMMIDARMIEIDVANRTEPGTLLTAGQIAVVSFKGITLPVSKLASIYNPILGSSAAVQYSSLLGTFQGKSGQWDLATHNSFEVAFAYAGQFTFSDGKITESWYDPFYLGYDKVFEGQGSANVNDSPVSTKYFSLLPDFTISVAESENVGKDGIGSDGYFTIYNPNGMLLAKVEALLVSEYGQTAGSKPVDVTTNPRGFDYTVVKKLRVIGPMTNDDFFGDFGMRRYSASPNDVPNSRMGNLVELDLSQALIPANTLPNFSLMGFTSLKALRLPIGIIINSTNVFNGDAVLDTIVCGDKPFVTGALDFAGSNITSLTASPNSNGLRAAKKIIFPDVPSLSFATSTLTSLGGGSSLLEEIVFLGKGTYITIADGSLRNFPNLKSVTFYQEFAPNINVGSNAFATNSGSGASASFNAVAYVRTPDANGYEQNTFRTYISGSTNKPRFTNVLKLEAPDLLINSAAEMKMFADEVNAGTSFNGLVVALGADIDLVSYTNWTPIGSTSANSFKGTFDGQGFVINNLTITGSSNYRGLFGYTGSNAAIKNLGIASGSVSGGSFTGAIVGSSNGGSLINCFNAANLNVGGYSGGLVGSCRAGELTISSCYNSGDITIRSSYDGRVGGIIGDILDIKATVQDCYNSGRISGGSEAGGIVGWIRGTVLVSNSYSVGTVTSSSPRGVVGLLSTGTVSNCYFLNSSAPNGGASTAIALPDSEMRAAGFASTLGVAFVAAPSWYNSGYPMLSWQVLPSGPVTDLLIAKAAKFLLLDSLTDGLDPADYTELSWATLLDAIGVARTAVQNATSISELDAVIIPDTSSILIQKQKVGAPGSGDIDGDGEVTMIEALTVAQFIVGSSVIKFSPEQLAAADMDSDGLLTMADVVLIMRKACGL